MLKLETHPDGVLLPVKAQAGSRRDEFRGFQDGRLKVSVTQVAEKGKANRAILALLARRLKYKKSQLEVLHGATQSLKTVLVRDTTIDQLTARIQSAVPG